MTTPVDVLVEHGVKREDAVTALNQKSFTQAATIVRFSNNRVLSLPEVKALLGLAICGKGNADWNEIGIKLKRNC